MPPPAPTAPADLPAPLPRKRLPIGIQTFRQMIEDGHYYVDKTGLCLQLVNQGKYYFLSRPRRFGKSLLLDTFRALFEGQRELFAGLAAEHAWDWGVRYPVIRISFNDGVMASRAAFEQRVREILHDNARWLDVTLGHQSVPGQLAELIEAAHLKTGQRAVVLIDEYDKPILDNIDKPELALALREGLKNLYSVLKGADEHLKFVLLTGVTKFSKVSIFSGLNQLQDISLDARYSALCGYTDADIDTVFAPELPGMDRDLLRRWYNGYNWLGQAVYNPFDVLLAFSRRQILPYWFETGTPTFLIKLLNQRHTFTPELSRIVASDDLLSTFDVDHIPPEALLFQAGYLTIAHAKAQPGRLRLTLKYPNLEVQSALNNSLLKAFGPDPAVPSVKVSDLYELIDVQDWPAIQSLFHAVFAAIPHDWYRNSPIAQYEGYWASVFYSYCAAVGFDMALEDSTNHGQVDLALLTPTASVLFEFKVVDSDGDGGALQQIKDRGYADKYAGRGLPVVGVGMTFSRSARNVCAFAAEVLSQP